MKLLVLSDLHLELGTSLTLPPGLECDAVVLAGDIHSPGHKAVRWAQRDSTFGGKPVLLVAGNHEFYNCEMRHELDEMRKAAEGSNVNLLDRDSVVIDGVRFVGCALWTDFQLPVQKSDGTTESDVGRALAEANRCMNDFRLIELSAAVKSQARGRQLRRLLRAEDTLAMHWVDRDWLRRTLAEPFDGPTVVVTHHAPAVGSVAERYAGDWLTPGFVSALPGAFFKVPAVWLHGHTHSPFDYEIGVCRVVSNPRGYRMRDGLFENHRFNPAFVVDVSVDSQLVPHERRSPADLDVRYSFERCEDLVQGTGPSEHEAKVAEREDMATLVEAARLVGGTVLAGVSVGRIHAWAACRHPQVIALEHPKLGMRFPRWQFEKRIWPVVQQLAMALGSTSGMGMLRWLETPHGALEGRTPRAALEQGERAERVLALAGAEGL